MPNFMALPFQDMGENEGQANDNIGKRLQLHDRLILFAAEFTVQRCHFPGVVEDKNHEYVYRALLRKPEAQFESSTWNANLVELLHKEHPTAKGNREPNTQE